MANQDIETVIRSLDKVWDTLDELGELQHSLEALNLISEHLTYFSRSGYFQHNDHSEVELAHHVGTQINMINDYSKWARDILRAYEDKLRSKIEESQLLLRTSSLESINGNSLPLSTKHTLKTCNNFVVDNIDSEDYYYW